MSSIGTPLYHLSSFVADILSAAFQNYTEFNIKDSFTFAERCQGLQIPNRHILLSFDAVSLFTNIPVDLVLEIIETEWHLVEQISEIGRDLFVRIVNFIFSSSYFMFEDQFYHQIFGTPMGSPLSPVVATIVLDHLFRRVLPDLPHQPGLIYKYVDDVILSLPEECVEETLDLFNGYNGHIQFTCEREVDGRLPFLDMLLIRDDDNNIKTDWYQKRTNSNRYIHYRSNHPINQKINMVTGLKDRVMKLSHKDFHIKNLQKLWDIFLQNGYPRHMLKKLLHTTNKTERLTDITAPKPPTPTYKRLPFVTGLSQSLSRLFISPKLRISYYNLRVVGDLYTRLKADTPECYTSGVVYCIPCKDCGLSYVGQTGNHLKTRIAQHEGDIAAQRIKSALSQHALQSKHEIDFGGAQILFRKRMLRERLFFEMVGIKKTPNTMNIRSDLDGLSSVYSHLLDFENSQYSENRNVEACDVSDLFF